MKSVTVWAICGAGPSSFWVWFATVWEGSY